MVFHPIENLIKKFSFIFLFCFGPLLPLSSLRGSKNNYAFLRALRAISHGFQKKNIFTNNPIIESKNWNGIPMNHYKRHEQGKNKKNKKELNAPLLVHKRPSPI